MATAKPVISFVAVVAAVPERLTSHRRNAGTLLRAGCSGEVLEACSGAPLVECSEALGKGKVRFGYW